MLFRYVNQGVNSQEDEYTLPDPSIFSAFVSSYYSLEQSQLPPFGMRVIFPLFSRFHAILM